MNSGGGFGVAAGAMAGIGTRMAERQGFGKSEDHRRHMEIIHQVPIGAIQVPISSGSGVFQMNDLLGVRAGYMWDIKRLTASGYTAGTVVVYKGGMVVGGTYTGGGDPFPFSAAGTATIGRSELILDQGDSLVVVCGTAVPGGTAITLASGFTGVQINGAATIFERWYLPYYLGISLSH